MNKRAEEYLWDRIRLDSSGPLPRDIIARMVTRGLIKNPKQAWRTLEKWKRKGWYEYGTTIDLGWRTRCDLPGRKYYEDDYELVMPTGQYFSIHNYVRKVMSRKP